MPNGSEQAECLTLPQVAAALAVSVEQARRLCAVPGADGRFPLRSFSVGHGRKKAYRVRREWLEAFIREREQATAPRRPACVALPGRASRLWFAVVSRAAQGKSKGGETC